MDKFCKYNEACEEGRQAGQTAIIIIGSALIPSQKANVLTDVIADLVEVPLILNNLDETLVRIRSFSRELAERLSSEFHVSTQQSPLSEGRPSCAVALADATITEGSDV